MYQGYRTTTIGPAPRAYAHDRGTVTLPPGGAGASYSGPGVSFSGPAVGTMLRDRHGYGFRIGSASELIVVETPAGHPSSGGTVYRPGSTAYETIVARLKPAYPDIEALLGQASTGASPSTSAQAWNVKSFLQSLGLHTPEGQQEAARFVQEAAPTVQSLVQGLFGRGRDLVSLQARLARLRARILTERDPIKRTELQAEAQGVQAEIDAILSAQAGAQDAIEGGPSLPSPGVPFWVWPSLVLGVVAVGGFFLYSHGSRRR